MNVHAMAMISKGQSQYLFHDKQWAAFRTTLHYDLNVSALCPGYILLYEELFLYTVSQLW
jgi:hypothetical protein